MLTRIALVLALALGTFAACDATDPLPVGDAGMEVARGVDAGGDARVCTQWGRYTVCDDASCSGVVTCISYDPVVCHPGIAPCPDAQ